MLRLDYSSSRRDESHTSALEAFVRTYTQILECGGPLLQKVLEHMRDHPDQAFLISLPVSYTFTSRTSHSSADRSETRKDRTSLFASIILMVRRARAYTHLRDALTLCLQLLGAHDEKSSLMTR